MVVVYFDASALAKRYSPEDGSDLVDEVFARLPVEQLACATIGMLEIVSVLVRKHNGGRLSGRMFAQALVELHQEVLANPHFKATPVNDAVIFAALNLIHRHNVNATDAIVLRSAINLQLALAPYSHRLLFWCCDKRLIRAAKAEGIEVFDPEVETLTGLELVLLA